MKNTVQKSDNPAPRVLFATFSPWTGGVRLPTNGSVEPMIRFFSRRASEFVLLDQPIPQSDFLLPRIEVYAQTPTPRVERSSLLLYLLLPLLWLTNKPATQIPFKIRDFLSALLLGMRGKPYDLFIGMESINALAGVILRTFGRVKTVVYYVSDYSPNRYANGLFNRVYLWLDRTAATRADFIWDVSRAMQPARVRAGLRQSASAPVIHVPNGLYESQIHPSKQESVMSFSLAYLGTLGIENGPDVAIRAVARIAKKYPGVSLHIVGGGSGDIERLKQLARDEKVGDRVHFHGFVVDPEKASAVLSRCVLGLAPYRAIPGSPRYYADAGKIRIYCGAGLPVVTSDVPPLGKDVAKAGGAVITKDTPEAFADSVIAVFSDRKRYLQMRKAAIQFAKDSTWDRTFERALVSMRTV